MGAARGEPIDFQPGDAIRLRKPHPCGSHDWTVFRIGADIGLKCQGCGRRVFLTRRDVERRLQEFLVRVERPGPPETPGDPVPPATVP